jgi:hypothetical protein
MTDPDNEDDEDGEGAVEAEEDETDLNQFGDLGLGVITREVQDRASKKRDTLAAEMWRDYVAYLEANEM